MSDHLSRKELKTDSTAVAAQRTLSYFATHQQQVIRLAIAALVVVVVVAGVVYYRTSQHTARELALGEALNIQSAPVGTAAPNGALSFATEPAKQDAAAKALNRVINNYGGSDEAYVAEYTLAGADVDASRIDSAKKRYQNVADHAGKNYASLAKMSLAQIDFAEGKTAEGEKLLRDLVDNPTDLVSKDQASIALARAISRTRPADAKKLLEPIIPKPEIGTIAMQALGEISSTK